MTCAENADFSEEKTAEMYFRDQNVYNLFE
jgi:hypothetical protein